MAKVTDFGIAKAVSNSTITAFGTTIGSVHYFSPEHARGGFTDAKSDLYSLGVVMYEMLTGKVPFDADTPVSVALKQVQEEPVDPITYNKDIPISVNRIILKAMQKDPNLRYQNATEMLKDLSMALKRPNEDFVVLALQDDNSPTQKVPTIYDLNMEENNDKNAKIDGEETENKGKLAKIKEFYSKHKFLKILTIIAILIIIFILTALIAMGVINGSRTEQSYLPDEVIDVGSENLLTEDEVVSLLEEAGFTNIVIEYESSDTIDVGYVISINPNKANYLYNLDQEIIVTVSTGPEMVTLPTQIVGKTEDEIVSELEKLGLTVNVTYETSETVESGIVLSVEPDEGEEITTSTIVNLVVSSGSQYADITMISVVGETESSARSKLSALSGLLNIEVTYDEDTSKEDGIVLSQTISEGKVIKENETITIVVNQLPTESTITFNINVASYYEDTNTNTSTETDDEENNETNTSENTSSVKNVSVVIYIGGVQVNTKSISTDTENYSYSYETSGKKEVQITVGGNEVYKQTLDFSSGDQTITISK